jgi:DNA-binding MarR family transcriptional regulator
LIPDPNVWLTQQKIAEDLQIELNKVRQIVATLSRAGVIKTVRDPRDTRYILVHKDSVPTIRQTIFGAAG